MILKLQQAGTSLHANQQVCRADHRADWHVNFSLLLAILIIPTPSGVSLIA